MPAAEKPAQKIDKTFKSKIQSDGAFPTFIELAGSAELFGTRRPVKVGGTIDGHPFTATLMPSGEGPHWLPVKAALRKLVDKDTGAEVTVHLQERLS
ncbi:DUF1905 domain-containing protein [Micromonospora sp. NPDC049523]|uniref:DUF1905 domain-containing protein n=1 Tax=Micromonospora sp. NPDC049523 TaxID=3155921 RepID=UPI0034269D8C